MRARLGVDQLRVDPHPVLITLHGAFKDVTHAKFLADLLGVDRLALEGKGRVARDHETVADAREIGRQVLGYAVGEIVLGRVAGEIGEGQHDEGKTRGLGRRRRGRGDRRWRYDRGGAGSGEKIPSASHNCDERDDPRSQRQERRARFRLGQLRVRLRLCPKPRLGGDADLQRKDPDRPFDVLERLLAKIDKLRLNPAARVFASRA